MSREGMGEEHWEPPPDEEPKEKKPSGVNAPKPPGRSPGLPKGMFVAGVIGVFVIALALIVVLPWASAKVGDFLAPESASVFIEDSLNERGEMFETTLRLFGEREVAVGVSVERLLLEFEERVHPDSFCDYIVDEDAAGNRIAQTWVETGAFDGTFAVTYTRLENETEPNPIGEHSETYSPEVDEGLTKLEFSREASTFLKSVDPDYEDPAPRGEFPFSPRNRFCGE